MTNPFTKRGKNASGTVVDREHVNKHQVESDFVHTKCRFVLTCSCGATHETRYIDEALEWSSMHKEFAPLSDQLTQNGFEHG